ncbi:hypothetical protein FX988_02289 [Paraglaciecola mesophila]|uniref:DUF4112 domain-containing protein n=1 Tax=Paraglaciecola mesophila TaxID=197222 RepID=A0A857JM47_9ALTE|nr:DUF4112 domain-containing protein [Paraglaciecola mesophila]QHJ12047.1 hypothetical protein FX988_02289 [Paraglaciecola mesophila]
MVDSSEVKAPQALRRAQKLAHMLDTAVGIPFTKIRFGLDSLLGLIPGVGDLVTVGLSAHIIHLAGQMGAPMSLRVAMVRNAVFDFLIGLIPFVGDISDIFYKGNRKNIRLLETWWVSTHHKQLSHQTAEHLAKWEKEAKSGEYD